MTPDDEHLANIEALTEACEDAIRRGKRSVSVELSPVAWLSIFEEIRNRRRANYSALIADQHVRELDDLVTRLQDVLVYTLANVPGSVSDAMAHDATTVRGKPVANRLMQGLRNLAAMRGRDG